MGTTSIRMDTGTRDRLAAVAGNLGVSQDVALNRLIDDYEMAGVHSAYARLQQDPEAWGTYRAELAEWDAVAADGMNAADDEYPEYRS